MTTFRTGNGAAWLDLLSSLSGRYRAVQVDALDSPAAVRAWFDQFGLAPSGRIGEPELHLVRRTREALHRVAVAGLAGARPDRSDLRLLSDVLAADQPVVLQASGATLGLRRPRTATEALARLVRTAVQDLTGPDRLDLRACGDDTCAGIFLDRTGRRRWCSDQQCGNRVRVAAHRARAKQS